MAGLMLGNKESTWTRHRHHAPTENNPNEKKFKAVVDQVTPCTTLFRYLSRYDPCGPSRLGRLLGMLRLLLYVKYSRRTCLQGLKLLQGNLAHEKYLDEANSRVKELEAEVAELRARKL